MRYLTFIMLLVFSSTVLAATDESVTLSGTKVKLVGNKMNVGDTAVEVKLISADLQEITVGGSRKNTQVFVVVPSIDTPICDLEARTFNEKAGKMKGVDVYIISMDLPFAGKRYCGAKGIDNVTVVSDFQNKAFGKAYGVLMGEGVLQGIEARAIFIVKDGKISYKQLVPEIKQRPDFEAVFQAI